MLRRTILSLVVVFGFMTTSTLAAPSRADATRAKANKLAKEGRTLEAASELRVAAETAGVDGPGLRFEAALMLQRSGELRDAIALHDEVSRDTTAGFDVRVRARYAEELLFWTLDFASRSAPAQEQVMELRGQLKESERRSDGVKAEDAELGRRLSAATAKINESRASLSALVGPNDPMIRELDGLVEACREQRLALPKLKQNVADAGRAIAIANRALLSLIHI